MKSSILVLNRELYPVSSGIARVHQLRNKVFILCIVAFMIPMNAVFANQTSSASSSPDNLTHEYRFNNGLRLIVKEDHRAPTVAHMVWYKAGSMDEINGRTGVAHVLEHMMFKGTKKVKAGDFSRLVAAVGGRENAFTSQDYTAYFQQVEKSKLLDVIRLESDRMANLQFSDEEFQKEIQVVMEERRLRTDDNPSSLMYESLMATAFMESPYRHPIIGWMNDLENLKPGDARLWYQNWYAPNNAIVVISGDVNPQEVKQWVDETYGQLPSRELAERKPQLEPAQRGIKRVNIKAPADGAQITMGWKVPHLNPERMEEIEPYALELLAAVLDGYDNARLNRELVREKQVANSIDADYDLISRGPQLF
jgi:zinc protease